MGKLKPKVEVVQYFMSIWYGFATGPVDSIKKITINEKIAWEGDITESSVITLRHEDMFGGIKKEGGVNGAITYLDGRSSQVIPSFLAQKFGLTEETCPAHRGIASLFFSGGVAKTRGTGRGKVFSIISGALNAAFTGSLDKERGFYWSANQPTIPPTWITATRSPKVLETEYAMIGNDANPVHMIYEIMTNTSWGVGVPVDAITVSKFTEASRTVFAENIAISLLWTEQSDAESFIADILEYINGVIFVNPRNGRLEIELIRGGYDVETLFEITPENSKLSGYQRKLWADTINEITVTWTNPESEEEETVTLQDSGNIAMQGGVPISDSKNYKGARSADLAMRLGARDLRVAASPLASMVAVVNRSAWAITPGSVVKVTWPEHGMVGVPMRVGEVDYGKTNESKIRVPLLEDVFGLDAGSYNTPPTTAWISESVEPSPLDYSLITTVPYYMIVQDGTDVSSLVDPDILVAVLGADNGPDVSQYVIMSESADSTGTVGWNGTESRTVISRSLLTEALAFSATTSIASITLPTPGYGVEIGSLVILGTTDQNQEVCVITAVGTTSLTLKRGTLDTTPKEWPVNTPIWFMGADVDVIDSVVRLGEQTVTYKLLTVTSLGILAIDDAPEISQVTTRRPWLPSRPANVKVDSIASGTVNADGAVSVTVTWSNRNRLTEDSVIMGWTDASITPEVGQTTTIKVFSTAGVLLSTTDGLTGDSYVLPVSAFTGGSVGFVQVLSKNADGDESLQGHKIRVIVAKGYGDDYGMNYG